MCANELYGLIWKMRLRNNVCDDISMPKCDSSHARVPADLALTLSGVSNSGQLCS